GCTSIGAYIEWRLHLDDESLDKFRHPLTLRAGNFDGMVQRRGHGCARNCGSHFDGCNRLYEGRRQADGLAANGVVDDVKQELKELRRLHDCEWDAGRLDHTFLQGLAAKIGTGVEAP